MLFAEKDIMESFICFTDKPMFATKLNRKDCKIKRVVILRALQISMKSALSSLSV